MGIWAYSYNETVTAIAYNPSRMGAYTHLKVAQKAILKGGLKIEEPNEHYNLNIASKNGVTVIDGSDETLTNRCPDATNCSRENQNEITNIKPEGYNESNICSTGDPALTCKTNVNAPYVMVQGISASPVQNFSFTGTIPSAEKQVSALVVYGGTLTVQGADNQDSYIGSISNNGGDNGTVERLKLTAGRLEVASLYITDSLQLGNVTIVKNGFTRYAFKDRTLTKAGTQVKVSVLTAY